MINMEYKTYNVNFTVVTEDSLPEDGLGILLSESLEKVLDDNSVTTGLSFIHTEEHEKMSCSKCKDLENTIKQLKKHKKFQDKLIERLRKDGAKTPKERESEVLSKQDTINKLSAELGRLKRELDKGRF